MNLDPNEVALFFWENMGNISYQRPLLPLKKPRTEMYRCLCLNSVPDSFEDLFYPRSVIMYMFPIDFRVDNPDFARDSV